MESTFKLPDELINLLDQVSAKQNAQLRQCRTMLAGFKATKEQDLDYMDGFMDCLFDFMDQGSDVEDLYREYIEHIATFNLENAKERLDDLEDELGYKAHVVHAAAHLARELHKGQKDKGGNDYFRSHLLQVGKAGHSWKEQVVGFLHDAAEDTPHDVQTVIRLLKEKLNGWLSHPEDVSWKAEFEDDIKSYPGEICHPPTDAEWDEIAAALNLLNHHTAASREEYIARLEGHPLAIKVKLNDLRNNMDISRIANPTEKDHARLERYKNEYQLLINMLDDYYSK